MSLVVTGPGIELVVSATALVLPAHGVAVIA